LTVTDDDGDQITRTVNVTVNPSNFDYSDAPLSFGTAIHEVDPAISLGLLNDIDPGNLESANADADGAEDDGVNIPVLMQGQTATITAEVVGAGGVLQGWIDLDGSGSFEPSEQVATNLQDDGTGSDAAANDGIITLDVNVPLSATTDLTFARFRWSTSGSLDAASAAPDGEVEDYAVTILSDPRASLQTFTCTGDFYQVHGAPTSNVSVVDLVNGNFSTIGNTGQSIRGTGLDPDSGFAYGIQSQGGGLAGNVLFAIGSDGSSVNLGTVSGLTARNYASGDFGPNGLFYIRNNGNNRPLIAIDVNTRRVVTSFSPSGGISNPQTADFAFNPVDQRFYAVEASATNARLIRLTLNNNGTFTATSVGSTGIQTNGGGGNNVFGAMYADSAGNIFGVQNSTGQMYQFDSATGAPVLVGQAAIAGQNDGFFCSEAENVIPRDFGDAPVAGIVDGISTNYGEAAQSFSPNNALVIGAGSIDEDTNQSSNAADADADDGLAAVPEASGTSYAVTVPVLNATGSDAFLCGFVDAGSTDGFNGSFDAASERVCATVPSNAASQDVDLNFSGLDFSAAPGTSTFMRLRLSSVQAEAEAATGIGASIGEVEDYVVAIAAPLVPPSCQVAQAVSENLVPNRTLNASCVANVGLTSDGSIDNPGYCPQLPLPAGYEIAYDYVLPTDDRMLGLSVWANAGGAFGDAELRSFDLEVDYTDTSGALATLVMDNVNLGDTTSLDDPQSVTFLSNGFPVSLPNVSQVRINNLGAVGGSPVFRELQGVCGDDFSDAPATYSAPSHTFDPEIMLGATNTIETAAANDDSDAGDDGVIIPALTQAAPTTITAEVTGTGGFLQGWIDFDGSGTFEVAEQIATDLQDDGLGGDATAGDGTLTFNTFIPVDAATSPTFARFRWSTQAGLNPSQTALDGEVEDYQVVIGANLQPPFVCTPQLLQSFVATTGSPAQLASLNSLAVEFDAIGSTAHGISYNAIGINPQDGFLYGMKADSNELVRIGNDGSVVELGPVAGLPVLPAGAASSYISGDFNGAGEYVIASVFLNQPLYKIDITTRSVISSHALSGIGGFPANVAADIGYNPVRDTFFTVTLAGSLLEIDVEAGTAVTVGPTGIATSAVVGAVYGDSAGRILGSYNDGQGVFEFDLTTGAGSYVSPVPPSGINDGGGALCQDASLNLPPVIDLNSIANGLDINFGPVDFIEDGFDMGGNAVGSGSVAIVDTDGDVSDVNEADIVTMTLAVDLASVLDGAAEILSFAGTDFPLDADGAATVTAGGTDFLIDYVAATGIFTITNDTGSGTVMPQDALDALIVQIAYNHTSDEPTEGVRNFSFTVSDSSSTSRPAATSVNVIASLDTAMISGTVFFDNGTGAGAIAHDGVIQGEEARAGDITVEAIDVASGNVIATTQTAGDGTYTLELPAEQNGVQTNIRITLPSGPVLISRQSANPSAVFNPASGTFTLTPAAGDSFAGLDFGLAGEPRLTESQSRTVAAGSATLFAHTFTAETAMEVSFALQNQVQSVDGLFTVTLFSDSDCDGVFGAGDTVISGSLPIVAGEQICLLVRAASDAGAPDGASLTFDLEASATYTNLTGGFATMLNPNVLTNSDVLTVGNAGSLVLTKEVCNTALVVCDPATGAGFTRLNNGTPGDVLIYRILFEVVGTEPVDDLSIVDITPSYSSLTATPPATVALPADLTCTFTDPASPAQGYEGVLAWECIGRINPGSVGIVAFEVAIAE